MGGGGHTDASRGIEGALSHSAYGRVLRAVSEVKGFNSGSVSLRMPVVVVIGDENEGKSSTLERIANRSIFPRGDGFTTRMVIKLCLRRSNAQAGEGTLSIRCVRVPTVADITNPDKYEQVEEPAVHPLHDLKDPAELVRTAMDRLVALRAGEDGDDGYTVLDNELLEITVATPSHNHAMDFYDLPGIVGAPPEVFTATRALTDHFLSLSETIVLCVLSARATSLRNSQALGLVLERGVASRTLAVLSQVDLATNMPRLEQRIAGTSPELKGVGIGFVCGVHNRPEGSDISLAEVATLERDWFQKNCPAALEAGRGGLGALAKETEKLLTHFIQNNWAEAEVKRLEEARSQVAAKIFALGPVPHDLHAEDVADAVLNLVERHVNEAAWTDEHSIALIPPAAVKLWENAIRTRVKMARFIDLIAESWQANTDLIADIVESSIAHGFDDSKQEDIMPGRFKNLRAVMEAAARAEARRVAPDIGIAIRGASLLMGSLPSESYTTITERALLQACAAAMRAALAAVAAWDGAGDEAPALSDPPSSSSSWTHVEADGAPSDPPADPAPPGDAAPAAPAETAAPADDSALPAPAKAPSPAGRLLEEDCGGERADLHADVAAISRAITVIDLATVGASAGHCDECDQQVLPVPWPKAEDDAAHSLMIDTLDKFVTLDKCVGKRTVVFVKNSAEADAVMERIELKCDPAFYKVHEATSMDERINILKDFCAEAEYTVLITTSLSPRELAGCHVDCVFQYSLPADIDTYKIRVACAKGDDNRGRALAAAVFDRERDAGIALQLVGALREAEQPVPGWMDDLA